MRIKYLATYNGPSYGSMGGYDEKMEGFTSIADAKDELDRRQRTGYGYVTTYARNANDLYVPWELDKQYDFPGTTREDFMELYRVQRVGAGLFWLDPDPMYRLTIGSRKGIKVEEW